MKINNELFEHKKSQLNSIPAIDSGMVERLTNYLSGADDWQARRINPYILADELGVDADNLLTVLFHSVRIGLLDFEYDLTCPACGGIEYSNTSMNTVHSDTFHCTMCHIDVEATLDDQLEVVFKPNAGIFTIEIDAYSDPFSYKRYFSSDIIEYSDPMKQYVNDASVDFKVVTPDVRADILFTARPGDFFRLINLETHSQVLIYVKDIEAASPQIVDIELLSEGLTPSSVHIEGGEVKVQVTGTTAKKMAVILVKPDKDRAIKILKKHPNKKKRYLTGKMLLNNQKFRDLFKVQDLSRDLKLRLRSITLLFTDLKGSTEMYDKEGDLLAYDLVQQHFEVLSKVVERFNGAIIKTMGDAIMASFSNPADGLEASIMMLKEMQQLARRWREHGYQLGLKLGLHTGPALAVNSEDKLDYFGQAVNIAARIQGLAAADEIFISESLNEDPATPKLLQKYQIKAERNEAYLKGVAEKAIVYKLTSSSSVR